MLLVGVFFFVFVVVVVVVCFVLFCFVLLFFFLGGGGSRVFFKIIYAVAVAGFSVFWGFFKSILVEFGVCGCVCVRLMNFLLGFYTHTRRTHARTHNIIHTYTKLSATQIIYE